MHRKHGGQKLLCMVYFDPTYIDYVTTAHLSSECGCGQAKSSQNAEIQYFKYLRNKLQTNQHENFKLWK